MIRSELSDWVAAALAPPLDLLVIGGGATGLGVAVQAALEGHRVALVEARDFASGTSSRSTKLVHGGVRYLAQGRVRMVREALRERAHVLALAPHLAQPLPFVVAARHRWDQGMTWLGLRLYEALAGQRSLGRTATLGAAQLQRLLPGLRQACAGVRYWDGQFEDARLALALARTAEHAGALLRNHTEVVGLQPEQGGWRVQLRDRLLGHTHSVWARSVVNATGVWVDALRRLALPPDKASTLAPLVRPSQGVHLVVARETLPLTEAVLVPRTSDGRVLFAVPWLGATVIGTTDTPREDAPLEPRPLPEELAFLLGETERALGVRLPPEAVRSVWVGLRPLVGGAGAHTRELSREHLIRREAPGLLTVTGGKWTTYRAMAEQVLQALRAQADLPPAPRAVDTAQTPLWGTPDARLPRVSLQAPPGPHLLGTAADALADLPGHAVALGLGLTEAIVRYSARHEWAVTVEDMLARRWRVLFLDARLAEQLAPRVAALLQQETGLDPQLEPFLALCRQYRLPGADGSGASPTLENAS